MPKRKRASILKSQGSIAWVMALWLVSIFVTTAISRAHLESRAALLLPIDLEATLLQMIGVNWPFLYFLFSAHRFFPKHPPIGVLISFGIFFLFAGLSALVSPEPYLSIGYLVFTFLAIWIVLQFNTNMTAADLDKAFKIYSILIALTLVFYTVFVYMPEFGSGDDWRWERGSGVLNPNAIALVCMSGYIAAFAYQNFMVKMFFVSINVTIIILMASRGSTIGVILAVVVFLWYRRKEWGLRHVITFWLVVLYLLTLVVVWWDPLMGPVKTYLALHDRSAGIETGAGRFVIWQEAWELFLSHPLFGVGYRTHELLMPSQVVAHNGYLAMLAEIGIIGFAALVYPIWKGIKFLWLKNTFDSAVSYAVLVSLAITYLYVAVYEPFFINFGNPTSILFLIAVFSYLIPYGERQTWRSSPKIGRCI